MDDIEGALPFSDEKRDIKRGNNGNHGAPGRSGRKPGAATILRRRLVADKVEEAEASFAYLCATRDNEDEWGSLRLAAAGMILERVLGKPRQDVTLDATMHADPLEALAREFGGEIAAKWQRLIDAELAGEARGVEAARLVEGVLTPAELAGGEAVK